VDPLFKNMTAKFNETGARGLILNNLPIDFNLDILLESKTYKEEPIRNVVEITDEIKNILNSI
jgi:condensin complex subunit 2